jgi:hypothetical protein
MSEGMFRAGDYSIKKFELISSTGGSINLLGAFDELSIFEDLYNESISGQVLVKDSKNMIGSLDLHGNEHLYIIFDKPSLDEPIEKFFRVYKVSNRIVKSRTSTAYAINFTTEDQLISNQYKLSKSCRQSADAEIINILKNNINVNPNKIISRNFEPSFGATNLVIPYMRPFQAIQFITSRTVNRNGSHFFFYENREGYNFKSLENILSQKVYKNYFLTPKILEAPNPALNFSAINSLIIDQNFDTLGTLMTGGFGGRMKNLNILKRFYYETDISLLNKKNIIGKGYPINDMANKIGDNLFQTPQAFEKYFINTTLNVDFDDYPNDSEKFILRSMEQSLLNNFRMTVTVPGDPLVKVGDLIDVNLPAFAQNINPEQELDEFYSGIMLVTSVRHSITPTDHITYMTVVKDSVANKIPAAAESTLLNRAKNE